MRTRASLATANLDDLLLRARAASTLRSPEMDEIIRRFRGLARSIAETSGFPTDVHDDGENGALMGLVRAVRRHDGRPGFVMYAKRYMHGAAIREMRKAVRPSSTTLVDGHDLRVAQDAALTTTSGDPADLACRPWGGGSLNDVVSKMSDQQQMDLRRRYVDDATLRSIADQDGVTEAAVSQRLKSAHRRIVELLLAA
jgi:RNA polymerase sigma factor (sigma-70 family)